jgi:hypothetical protein
MPTRSEIMKNAKNGQKSDRKRFFFSELKKFDLYCFDLDNQEDKKKEGRLRQKFGDTFEIKERKISIILKMEKWSFLS